ncbi:MAG: hypothetical protein RLZ06_201 [Actinomycetota bacterium]|jgi:hypothetical protein
MLSNSEIQSARRTILLDWGFDEFQHYNKELGFDVDFENDLGFEESGLVEFLKHDKEAASKAVSEALGMLLSSLEEYPELKLSAVVTLHGFTHYWLFNASYDLALSLWAFEENAYDSFRMNGLSFEDSEAAAEIVDKQLTLLDTSGQSTKIVEAIFVKLSSPGL